MRILLSFAGSHDPFNTDGTDGPLLSLLRLETFNHIYLFHNNDDYLKRASNCKKEYDKRGSKGKIHYIDAKVPDPTDYKLLYQVMNDKCQDIIKEHREGEIEYFISTTSGTPQMATVWILLNKSGLVPGKLLQVLDAKFNKDNRPRVRELNLDLDDFKQENSPDEIKRKLSLYKTKSDVLEEILEIKTVNLIGESRAFKQALNLALKFSKYREPILLYGESGTGKEEFAKLIHEKSKLEGVMIPVNAAGFTENLLEAELFGYVKGAFTGATTDKKGIVEQAENGTIFFDEISELPLSLQAKLLRFLNDGVFRRVGDTKEMVSNARIITATNRDLGEMVKSRKFGKDLLHRINMAIITLPPLNERKEDVPLLAKYFLEGFNHKYDENKTIELSALHFLMNLDWKDGNVRALRNLIGSLFMKVEKQISEKRVEEEVSTRGFKRSEFPVEIPENGIRLKELLQRIEKQFIYKAMEITKGNKLEAAKLLGYSRIDHKLN